MSAHLTLVGPAYACANTVRHSPAPLIFDLHHILPDSWGGPTNPTNLVTICPTCHHSAHILIDLYVKLMRAPTAAELKARFGRQPSKYIAWLAGQAWLLRPPNPTPTS